MVNLDVPLWNNMAGYLAPHRKFQVGQGFLEDQDRRRQSNLPVLGHFRLRQ